MYGYNPPKRPELHSVRVMICESEINGYLQRFPALSRHEVLAVMIDAGPERKAVDAALARLATARAPG
jgi:hypothetical protein